jgi:molybdopterin molybdotransferase
MLSIDAARLQIAEQVLPLPPVTLPLGELRGRVLREPLVASEDFPGFDRSAMDGYAICAEDPSASYTVVGDVSPGSLPDFEILPGQCARIFTGGALPKGASQVVMQEDVSREGDLMAVRVRTGARHVRRRGEDARVGDELLGAGRRIGASEAALLAQMGRMHALVSPAPRVIHWVTGDELVPPGQDPKPGQIRDSNSTLVAGMLADAGARLVAQRHSPDSLEALVSGIQTIPPADWDLLLISGGASVGDYDFGLRALRDLGFTLHFHALNVRPGKPLVFATRGAQVAFVLPGNPASHFVVFHLAVRAALERLEGAPLSWPLVELPLATDFDAVGGARATFWPARASVGEAGLRVSPLKWQSSGDLFGLRGGNALILCGSGGEPAKKAGVPVKCLLLDWRQ